MRWSMTISRRYPRASLALLFALALLAPTLALTPPARADDCIVTDSGDSTSGLTLRNRLGGACPTITFQPGLGTITVQSTLLVDHAVTIQGPGEDALTIQGQGTFPLLWLRPAGLAAPPTLPVPAPITVAISGLTLTKGHAS